MTPKRFMQGTARMLAFVFTAQLTALEVNRVNTDWDWKIFTLVVVVGLCAILGWED